MQKCKVSHGDGTVGTMRQFTYRCQNSSCERLHADVIKPTSEMGASHGHEVVRFTCESCGQRMKLACITGGRCKTCGKVAANMVDDMCVPAFLGKPCDGELELQRFKELT